MIAIKDGQKIGEIDVGVSDGETGNAKIGKKVKIVARLRLWKNLTLNKYLGSRAGSGNMALESFHLLFPHLCLFSRSRS